MTSQLFRNKKIFTFGLLFLSALISIHIKAQLNKIKTVDSRHGVSYKGRAVFSTDGKGNLERIADSSFEDPETEPTLSVLPAIQAPNLSYANSTQIYTTGTTISPLIITNTGGAVPAKAYGQVTTIAGSGTSGNTDGTGSAGSFNTPTGLTADAAGNVYVADMNNHLIRKITPAGVVTTFAGSGIEGHTNGTGTAASFSYPAGVAVDAAGNLYVADQGNNLIRKIDSGGVVTTFAGNGFPGNNNGAGRVASFNGPTGVTLDAAGNVYVADQSNNLIRKITAAGLVTTLAGSGSEGNVNGTGTAASFKNPSGVAVDTAGNVYVADADNHVIRKISALGVVTTLAGSGVIGDNNGTGSGANFYRPYGVAVDASGNVYVADYGRSIIRKISQAGVVTNLAGSGVWGKTDGTSTAASFTSTRGIAVGAAGSVYVTDEFNHIIRKIGITGYSISPGLPDDLKFDATTGTISGTPTVISPATIYTITGYNTGGSSITSVTLSVRPSVAPTTTVAAPIIKYANDAEVFIKGMPIGALTPVNTGGPVPPVIYGQVSTLAGSGAQGKTNGAGNVASFFGPAGLATDATGNVYVADEWNHLVRKITAAGEVSTIAGNGIAADQDGSGTSASFNHPKGIVVAPSGEMYIADNQNNKIRKMSPSGLVSTFAGNGAQGYMDGPFGASSNFYMPAAVALDVSGNIYVAEEGNNIIRKVNPDGRTTTFAGSPTGGNQNGTGRAASFNQPDGVAIDIAGNVYVADYANSLIRKITPEGVVTTLAGSGGFMRKADGLGTAAGFWLPTGIVADASGNLFVTDGGNNIIRKITPAGLVTTVAGSGGYGSANGIGRAATFSNPIGLTLDNYGNLYIADTGNNLIRKMSVAGYTISPALPPGLNFDSKTGIITGTPTVLSPPTAYTITAYNGGGASSTSLLIAVGNTRTFGTMPEKNYGEADFSVDNNTTGAKTYGSSNPGVATINNGQVHIAGAGNTTIMIGDGSDIKIQAFTVKKVPLIIKADDQNKIYGAAIPTLSATYTGFVNGETSTVLKTKPAITTVATPASAAGTYPLNASGAVGANYTISYVAGTLTVNKAALTITADNKSKTYGAANPALTVTYTGFVNSDTLTALTTQPTVATTATAASSAGTYPLTASGAVGANYTISYVAGTLTVNKAALTITADNKSKTYGAANPALTVTYTGFVNSDTLTALTTQPAIATTATTTSAVGNYPVTVSGAVSANYAISYLAGTLKVNKAELTISADNKTKVSGGPNPALTVSYSGFVSGETQSVLTTQPVVTTAVTTSSPAGVYSINISGAAAGNYVITHIAGVFIVTAPVITAPRITAVTPSGNAGSSITIKGSNFTGATVVKFGGAAAASFTVKSSTEITAVLGDGASGNVSVTTSSGTASLAGFVFVLPIKKPAITYQTPQVLIADATIAPLNPVNTGDAVPAGYYSQVTAFAGGPTSGAVNGTGTAATFNGASGIAKDGLQNIYITDTYNNLIRRITPAGVATTFAGSGAAGAANGTGTAASFNSPVGIASDPAGNLYVADKGNNMIRKITPLGEVTTLAGSTTPGAVNGTGSAVRFNGPLGVATDVNGTIYVADAQNNLIRKITPAGAVTTFAGSGVAGAANGMGTAAAFNRPTGLAVDNNRSVFVVDQGNNVIRKITKSGVVTTFAGSGLPGAANGVGAAASFNSPYGITVDDGNTLFVTDQNNHLIRRVNSSASVSTIAGNSTTGTTNSTGAFATFQTPLGIAFDGKSSIYITDSGNNLVRKLAITGYKISPTLPAGMSMSSTTGIIRGTPSAASANKTYTVVGYNGAGSSSTTLNITVLPALAAPAISYNGDQAFVVDSTIQTQVPVNAGGAIPAVVYGAVSTLAGNQGVAGAANGTTTSATFNSPRGVAADTAGNLYIADANNALIRKVTPAGVVTTYSGKGLVGSANGALLSATFNNTDGIAVDAAGNMYISDTGNERIRKITAAGLVTTVAGSTTGFANGFGTAAKFNSPKGLATDAAGNIYVADQGNYVIRKLSPGGTVTTYAGSGTAGSANGQATAASFSSPVGLAFDGANSLYVTDGALIRKITTSGVVSTLAGGAASAQDGAGTAAGFTNVTGISIDRKGNLYVLDVSKIRRITPAGVVTTIASDADGFANGNGTGARFSNPYGITTDNRGNLYVADTGNGLIRKIIINGYTIAPALPAGLNFDATTGTISGIPAAATAKTAYQISGYNTGGSSVATLNITVNNAVVVKPPPPVISYASQTYTRNVPISPLAPSNSGGVVPATPYAQVTNYAGNGNAGSADGRDSTAQFKQPSGMAADGYGNIYIADRSNHKIRKVTPGGAVVTIAGSGLPGAANGPALSASFNLPGGLEVDNAGNVYVADSENGLIRKITNTGMVSTLASGLTYPVDIAIDNSGNLFVAEGLGTQIKKVTPAGVVSGFANGFHSPFGVAVDAANNVYVTDFAMKVYKVSAGGVVSVLAGSGATGAANGTGAAATFSNPNGIKVDAAGNVYVADTDNGLVRKITPAGVVTTLAGDGTFGSANGVGTAASFKGPYGIALDSRGNLFVSERAGNKLRRVSLTGYNISPALPEGLTLNTASGIITGTPTVVMPKTTYTVAVSNSGGVCTSKFDITVSNPFNPDSAPEISYASQNYTKNVDIGVLNPTQAGGTVPATLYAAVSTFAGSNLTGSADGTGASAKFKSPSGAAFDHAGNLFVVDMGGQVIRKITPDGAVTTFAGNGTSGAVNSTGTASRFSYPVGVAIDANDNLFVTDRNNQLIRKITPAGVATTFAGGGAPGSANGNGTAASFSFPTGIAIDATGNLFVADSSNGLIRKITPAGTVTTLAGSGVAGSADGTGTAASFSDPRGVAVDRDGNVYVSEFGGNRIRKITQGGVVTTFAGTGAAGQVNGNLVNSTFFNPMGLAIDQLNNLYIADNGNSLIRKISTAGEVSTLAGKTNTSASTVDAVGAAASFYQPYSIAVAANGALYVADYGSHRIRKIITTGYTLSVVTPSASAIPAGLSFDATTGTFTGTPTVSMAATSYKVTAYNYYGNASSTFTISVSNPSAIAAAPVTTANILTVAQPSERVSAERGVTEPKVNPAVSPNGDGRNDMLAIEGIEAFPNNTLLLFDKTGRMVYEKTRYDNVNNVFDGHSGINRKLLPAGTYFYQLNYVKDKVQKRKTGFFIIKY